VRKRESSGVKDFHFDIRVEPSNQARAMKIMEAVSTALKSRAFQIRVEGEKKTSAEKDGVSVQFHIEELCCRCLIQGGFRTNKRHI